MFVSQLLRAGTQPSRTGPMGIQLPRLFGSPPSQMKPSLLVPAWTEKTTRPSSATKSPVTMPPMKARSASFEPRRSKSSMEFGALTAVYAASAMRSPPAATSALNPGVSGECACASRDDPSCRTNITPASAWCQNSTSSA